MFTKEMFRKFREDFAEAVKGLEEKYVITLSIGNITYSQEEFHTKLTGEIKRTASEQEDKNRKEFESFVKMHPQYKLKPEMYNAELEAYDGEKYKIIGVKPKASKNIIIIEATSGKQYVCPPQFLKLDEFEVA